MANVAAFGGASERIRNPSIGPQCLPISGAELYFSLSKLNSVTNSYRWHEAIGRQWLRDATALPPLRQEIGMMHSPRSPNHMLASLAASDSDALLPHMQMIDLPQGSSWGRLGRKLIRSCFRTRESFPLWSV
jgi:hypothetical protein